MGKEERPVGTHRWEWSSPRGSLSKEKMRIIGKFNRAEVNALRASSPKGHKAIVSAAYSWKRK